MRMSEVFGTTLREAPAGAPTDGHALLARAGYLRLHGGGLQSWLPVGARSLQRIAGLLLRELESLRGQPVVISPDAESVIPALCRTEVRSWRHLPRLLVSAGGAGALTCFFLAADGPGLDAGCRALRDAAARVLDACGLPAIELTGPGGLLSLAFVAGDGDVEIARCRSCGAAGARPTARFARAPSSAEEQLPLEKAATPGCTTIDDLCHFLGVPRARTAKVVFQVADEETFVFAVVRGDRELSGMKLRSAIGARTLRPASPAEILATGAVPGYASPIGTRPSTVVVVDEELPGQRNLVAGANEEGFHLLNTNIPRDYRPSLVADIALLPDGASCAACGGELALTRGVELAVLARPGARRDEKAGAVYQDREGREMTVRTAQLSFHPERILLCAAGSHRDDHGLCLAPAIAPWTAHVVSLGGPGTEALAEAERLHEELSAAGLEVLFDDREESPGVKFADADLIGAPVRITVSARALKTGGVEVKARATTERSIVPRTGVVEKVRALLA